MHPFCTHVYFTIPQHERIGCKLGASRPLKGYFVRYSYSKLLQPCYKVVARYTRETYAEGITKDVIFDLTKDLTSLTYASEQDF